MIVIVVIVITRARVVRRQLLIQLQPTAPARRLVERQLAIGVVARAAPRRYQDIAFVIRDGPIPIKERTIAPHPTAVLDQGYAQADRHTLTHQVPGQLLIDGVPADPQKHDIAFVFQEPSSFPWLTVEQNISFGLDIKRKSAEERKKSVDDIIALMGLERFRNSYPSQLSMSSEQRMVIGRAFAMHPDLLLMDEPYSQMDIKMRYYLEDQVIQLWKATGSTVLFITHNLEEAVYLAQRILIMTNKPTTIKKIMDVDLPYPRNIADPRFIEIRKEVTDLIKWW